MHYLNAKIKKWDDFFFFSHWGAAAPITEKGSLALPGTDLGQSQALSPHPSPLLLPQQRRYPGDAGNNSSEAGNEREMCCSSLVDRRWHRAFIFTRARVDSYSLGVGKVSCVSYDVNKQPHRQARVRSLQPYGPRCPGAAAVIPGHLPPRRGLLSCPCLPRTPR